jgi:hypothetical protein
MERQIVSAKVPISLSKTIGQQVLLLHFADTISYFAETISCFGETSYVETICFAETSFCSKLF